MGKEDNIIIDVDIRSMIPPLTDDERATLEENIKADKEILSPLIVWKEKRILLDGHNRKEIGDRLGIGYRVKEISFTERNDAEIWVKKTQLGRRNLSPDQASIIRGSIYNQTSKGHGGARDKSSSGQNVHLKTSQKLAEEFGVTERTIRRDGEFAEAVEKVKKIDKEIGDKAIAGKAPPKNRVIKAAKVVDTNPKKAKEILDGKDDEKAAPPPVDMLDQPLPDRANIREAFASSDVFKQAMNDLRRVKSVIKNLGAPASYIRLQQFEADVHNAYEAVRFGKPHAVCPYCKGKATKREECNACKGLGWVCESIYTSAPREMRTSKGAA